MYHNLRLQTFAVVVLAEVVVLGMDFVVDLLQVVVAQLEVYQ